MTDRWSWVSRRGERYALGAEHALRGSAHGVLVADGRMRAYRLDVSSSASDVPEPDGSSPSVEVETRWVDAAGHTVRPGRGRRNGTGPVGCVHMNGPIDDCPVVLYLLARRADADEDAVGLAGRVREFPWETDGITLARWSAR